MWAKNVLLPTPAISQASAAVLSEFSYKILAFFNFAGSVIADNPEQVLLSTFVFRIRDRFFYEYDFGDGWPHEVRIEKYLPLDPKRIYPVCIDGKHPPPPEDCEWLFPRVGRVATTAGTPHRPDRRWLR